MKAHTQYNDFIGTSAADLGDLINLDEWLNEKSIDITKYKPIGLEFYRSEGKGFYVRCICINNEKSSENNPYVVSKRIDVSMDDFFNIFKRFNVLLTRKTGKDIDYQGLKIKEEIGLDDQ